jgi:hypothetical protein
MLGKLSAYIRQQHLALLALFIALGGSAYAAATINSADVVDNSLSGADVKGQKAKGKRKFTEGTLTGEDIRGSALPGRKAVNGSIFTEDIADNTLTGADVNEGTLGTVPKAETAANADKLDGKDSADFLPGTGTAVNSTKLNGQGASAYGTGVYTATESVSSCSVSPNTSNVCATIHATIPAGKTYRAIVWSSFTALTGASAMTVYYCPFAGSYCKHIADHNDLGDPLLGTSALGGGYLLSGAATSVPLTVTGTQQFGTLLNPDKTLGSNTSARVTTTVMLVDTAVPGLPLDSICTALCGGSSGGSSGTSSGGSSGTTSGSSGTSSGGSSGTTSGSSGTG